MHRLDHMANEVSEAYALRAEEYALLFGSMSAVHPSDRQLIATWADGLEGRVIDAGCGPGQWTNFLTEHRIAASGVDLVPAFIEHARNAYPGVPFEVGDLNNLDVEPATVAGILAWYSLIHHEPKMVGIPLREFGRALRPGGTLLIGFFEGPLVDKFAHGVTPAYRWPVSLLGEELASAGFEVVETHTRTTLSQRPHGAIIARRR